MKKPRVVGVGEILWDIFPDRRALGGAPANVAFHARSLGAEAVIISRVGEDSLGEEIRQILRDNELPDRLVQTDTKRPTGTVSVEVDDKGKPKYVIHEDVAWDAIAADASARDWAMQADALCFGSLAQRSATSRETIRELLSLTRPESLRVFDVNLRQSYYDDELLRSSLELANVLKLSDEELPVVADLFGFEGEDEEILGKLSERCKLRLVALTRGSRGSLLLADGRFSDFGGVETSVRDSVGAGDSFTATLVLGYLMERPLDEINERASQVAAFVCSQDGATPPLPDEHREWLGLTQEA